MKLRFLALLPLLCPLAHAQEPPMVPTVVWIPDGADAQMSTSSTVSAWFSPQTAITWPTRPAGFGPKQRFAEVSTVAEFQEIRIRQTFDFATPSDTLKLTLKHEAAALDVYLNGNPVISLAADGLPAADAAGFRHYDLSRYIGTLAATGNLLALHVRGNIAVPILHGTTSKLGLSSIGFDPISMRMREGGPPITFRVFRETPFSFSSQVDIRGIGENPASLADFKVRKNGNQVPLSAFSTDAAFFDARFSGSETSAIYEISATDEVHAEAQETLEIKFPKLPTAIPIIIPRNDFVVSRTALSGEGSLSQAIENAESMPGLETIGFSNDEGVPFSSSPVTVHLASGTLASPGLSEGFTINGPQSPGRVTIQSQALGGPLFYISGASGAASSQNLTLRRLVIAGSSPAVTSLRYNGSMLIEDCEFTGSGNALDLYGIRSAPVIRRCLFTGNSGYCIRSTSGLPPLIENCTFTANSGTSLDFSNTPTLLHCTFTGNPFRIVSGAVRFQNCLLTAETADIKLTNSDFDQGGNLFAGVLQAGKPVTAKHPSSRALPTTSAARLGTLGSNGGFTRSIPILADSPALDLGLPPATTSPAYDQRGTPYLRSVGPAPDAGAYEIQFKASDLIIGLQTDPQYDPITGLYFQFVVVHNTTPWTLTGFRLWASVLPSDATLYNASGPGYLDVAGPVPPSDYRVVILQYQAPRPDLRLLVSLDISLLSGSNLPSAAVASLPSAECSVETGAQPCLRFPSVAGRSYQVETSEDLIHWRTTGPSLRAESGQIHWQDPDPSPPARRYYRIADLGN